MVSLPTPVMKAGFRLKRFYHALFRPVTMGVRALVTDDEGRVLLIRHTYVPGWYMPGGGVGRDETLIQAMARELHEEAGVRMIGQPRLLGIYANFLQLKSDHVAVYVVEDWVEEGPAPHLGTEIAEIGFFPLDDLPAGIHEGTRRRLTEFMQNLDPTEFW